MHYRRLYGHLQVATLFTALWTYEDEENKRNSWQKWANIKMAVSLEPLDRFWCFNFWEKALNVYFHSGMRGSPSDPYNRCNATVAYFGLINVYTKFSIATSDTWMNNQTWTESLVSTQSQKRARWPNNSSKITYEINKILCHCFYFFYLFS